ncbi:hypothetical protein ADU37_CDS20070 [Thermococcus sp. 2319x1]|uniref:hypothetical protein n=1 Tax=Thermococcus sp. 2319x1 TaxID=1674923 RepID=UPI00073A974A|nr:hypothetical protein [Thermococcus sp. 2319x1]ALV63706.1 hypothetical protein ADU37_CDS20070 [Thermococcus sp. 2319x1]
MVRMKFARPGIIGVTLILVLAGLNNVSGAQISGKMLHVWDHSLESSYYVYRYVGNDKPLNIQWDAIVTNYNTGDQYVAIMAVIDDSGYAWGFFWRNGTVVIFSNTGDPSSDTPVKDTNVDGSSLHTYRIEVVYNKRGKVKKLVYYIDDNKVYTEPDAPPGNIRYIAAAGIFRGGKEFDMFIDNVEYTYSEGTISEDFEDGQDDFFVWGLAGTDDGKSGAEVVDSAQVPEFPFLEPIFDYLSSIVGLNW